jgi:hypothetical protein
MSDAVFTFNVGNNERNNVLRIYTIEHIGMNRGCSILQAFQEIDSVRLWKCELAST